MVKSHRDLRVWQAGMDLTVCVYKATDSYPKSEVFGMTSQMRRSASSIPANIAEGFSRQYKTEFAQYLHVAKGSLSELETFVELSERLGYLKQEDAAALVEQSDNVGKMLHGLITTVRGK